MRQRLSSGMRVGPPLPMRLLNTLGGPLKALGLFPRLEPRKLQAKAERKTGRSIWPHRLANAALPIRTEAFNNDAGLSLFGALAVKGQFVRCLSNALEFDRIIEEHPEILDEKINRPLFVLGLPRTGTTLLQRLLCLHSGARYLPFWEGYSPIPKKIGAHQGGRDGRLNAAKRSLALLRWIAPDMQKIHPLEAEDPDECYHLLRNHFLMPPGFDFAYLPNSWDWFAKQDAVDVYRLHKRQLQVLQWLDRRQHWVLKAPNHLPCLREILRVYPDARIVYTHRDPLAVVPSFCSLTAVAWGMTAERVDLARVGKYTLEMARLSQEAALSALATVPRDQITHVEFEDLMADPVRKALSIYERFGYPHDPLLAARMADWMRSHPRQKHGTHRYALSDFGLSEADVLRRLKTSRAMQAAV